MSVVDWFNENAGFAQVVLAAVLVAVTGYYAIVTHLMHRRSERLRFGAFLVVGPITTLTGPTDASVRCTIENIGGGPAWGLEVAAVIDGRRVSATTQDATLAGPGQNPHSAGPPWREFAFPGEAPRGSAVLIECSYDDGFGRRTARRSR